MQFPTTNSSWLHLVTASTLIGKTLTPNLLHTLFALTLTLTLLNTSFFSIRITEILLMGGIPVTRRSTISSCYDDTDNTINIKGGQKVVSRGSLPIVILDKWEDLTKDRLEKEWREKFMNKVVQL